MNSAIIVSAENPDFMEQILKNSGFDRIAVFSSGNETRRFIKNSFFSDIIIINTPLSDEFGQELAVSLSYETSAKTIMMCQHGISEEMAENLGDYGIIVLSKPVDRNHLAEIIHDIMLTGNVRESGDIFSRTDDIRTINKAKAVLMKYLNFTEPQAHRYIEKLAMNNRCTRQKAAQQIINKYN
ncbi:MAG: ANTAR domain-containing protein [Ruminococcus sp.]|nr:ANTAR domain-containing protein [Ruminococcus sp.]MDE7226089.1 ANTAR domain-containing protein [Ruminococcus sp.]